MMCGLGARHGFKLTSVLVSAIGLCSSNKSATFDVHR